jgi:hypothetical protein
MHHQQLIAPRNPPSEWQAICTTREQDVRGAGNQQMEDGMKANRFLVVVIATAMLLTAAAAAQTINLTSDVPFDFSAGQTMLKSGECTIHTLNNGIVQLRDSDNSSVSTLLIADDTRSANDAKLVFNRYGDTYFLSQIWNADYKFGVSTSKRERELKAANIVPVQVAVAATTDASN